MCELEWYVLRVKSHFEKCAALALQGREIEAYLPTYHRLHCYGNRTRDVELPLFPGYVFSRFDLERRVPVLSVPGVVHIVGTGRVPVPVNREELAAVRRIVESGLAVEPWPQVHAGERVVIERGPLRGLSGIVVAVKKNYRLVASVTLLRRAVSVEIERSWVRREPGPGLIAPAPERGGPAVEIASR